MTTTPDGPAPTLSLDAAVVARLREQLPAVAARTVQAVVAEVADYAGPLRGELGVNIVEAVELALGTFLRLIGDRSAQSGDPMRAALDGAYALGRGEARTGRTMDALLSAYRVGARASWREWGSTAVDAGVEPATVVEFAELVFAYIDRLSAASVAGHTDELATTGRVREQYLERLGHALLVGVGEDELVTRAERADWPVPETLTAVVVGASDARATLSQLGRHSLLLSADVAGRDLPAELSVLLVPDAGDRRPLMRSLAGRPAVVGPCRPWTEATVSFRRALRLHALEGLSEPAADTETRLAALVLTSDADALADLRARMLEPLADLPPATVERLAETLRSWLLHQGRREAVAADLLVHPQTVRYRMTQLRERYGDRLLDPVTVLELVTALGVAPG